MSTGKHYFVEHNRDGKYVVKEANGQRAASVHDTQEEAISEVRRLNLSDHPDVERTRNVATGGRDKWRSAE